MKKFSDSSDWETRGLLTEALDQAYDFPSVESAVAYLTKKYVLSAEQIIKITKMAHEKENVDMFNMIKENGKK